MSQIKEGHLMNQQTACFTGHRFLPRDQLPIITQKLEATISELYSAGIVLYEIGGALGFDTLAGFTVLEMKKKYPEIKLIMVLPCRNQDIKWRQPDRDKYRKLLDRADKTVCLQDNYDDDCMLRRNRYLVDNSSVCIAYLTQRRGGTLYTVNYAKKNGKRIINLADRKGEHIK